MSCFSLQSCLPALLTLNICLSAADSALLAIRAQRAAEASKLAALAELLHSFKTRN